MEVNIVVNVSDARVSQDPNDVLVTHSLGSCIGVCLYDPVARCAGMLHFQLPSSSIDAGRAQANPCMFADTGMATLLNDLAALGAQARRMQVKLAGGAEILDDKGVFCIGKRNHTAIRKILWQRGLLLSAETVGGSEPRTLYLHVADGTTIVKSRGESAAL
jgi:chemotaxis protein CheD